MEKFSFSYADPAILRPNPWNTNVVSPENEEKIRVSMNRFGIFRPLVVRETDDGLQILGGEHRWSIAKADGIPQVPIINVGRIDDAKAKEIGLVDNGRYGEDDALRLAELLNGLGDTDELLSFLPMADDDLANLFAANSIDLDKLGIDEDEDGIGGLPSLPKVQTHQIMRFKVPIEDSEVVQRLIDRTMKEQGFTGDDSMTNAGNALVHLLKNL